MDFLRALFLTPYGLLVELANKHKGFRRGLVVWCAMQIGWVIHRVFADMEHLNGFAISALTIVVAPLVGLLVYYVKLRSDDDGDPDVPGPSPPPTDPPKA